MSQFSTRIDIDAPADEVFSFVTEAANMPKFLPTLDEAVAIGDNKIRMKGEVDGHKYDTIGWFQVHEFNRTMLWGAEGMNNYSGDLEVLDQHGSCVLVINLKFEAMNDLPEEARSKLKAHEPEIQKGLEQSAQNVKSICEESKVRGREKSHGYVS